jgi:hypothetical protein
MKAKGVKMAEYWGEQTRVLGPLSTTPNSTRKFNKNIIQSRRDKPDKINNNNNSDFYNNNYINCSETKKLKINTIESVQLQKSEQIINSSIIISDDENQKLKGYSNGIHKTTHTEKRHRRKDRFLDYSEGQRNGVSITLIENNLVPTTRCGFKIKVYIRILFEH